MLDLTPSQKKSSDELKICLEKNMVALLCGPSKCGKKTVARNFLRDKKYREVDIVREMGTITNGIQLIDRLEEWIGGFCGIDYLLINNWEHLIIWVSSSKFKINSYSHDVVVQFTKKLEREKFKSIITMEKASAQSMVSSRTWMIQINSEQEDLEFLLRRFHDDEKEIENISSSIKTQNIEDVITWASQTNNFFLEIENWTERFKKIQSSASVHALDAQKDVSFPESEIHMLGIEETIEQIKKEVINPIKLSDPAIPICKGILLYGPPGVGKTTIGRWLSFILEGKVYLCEKNKEDLITVFNRMLKRAIQNSPSVVFIDDIDSILDKPSMVRDLLVALDGIQTNGREKVTVIMTCMDISLVPSALIRGGRLERCIEFKYPGEEVIEKIIRNKFSKSIDKLKKNHPEVAKKMEREIKQRSIDKMVSLVSGWSPSNIHLLVDVVIRTSVYEDCDPLTIFVKESKKMKELKKKVCQNQSEKEQSNSDRLYV